MSSSLSPTTAPSSPVGARIAVRLRHVVVTAGVIAFLLALLSEAPDASRARAEGLAEPVAETIAEVTPARLLEPTFPDAIPIGAIPTGPTMNADEGSGNARGTSSLDLRITAFLGALLAAVGFLKWNGRRTMQRPPAEVFAVLGEASLGGQHVARIVRFGPKTILVGVSGTTCTTLAEIDDPGVTDAISAACRPTGPTGSAGAPSRVGLPRRARAAARALMGAVVLVAASLPTAPALGADATGPALSDPLAATSTAESSPAGPNGAIAGNRPTTEIAALPAWSDFTSRALGPRSVDGILSAVILFGVASIAPAILLMTTSFVRMSVVLSLVRQGLGTQGLPSNQIVTSLALFLSLLVMWPVWTSAYREGVQPLQEGRIDASTAFERGSVPVRRWMASQIERAGNRQTMLLFLARHPSAPREVRSYDEVPLETLLPAFLVSELKTAFSIGVRLLLPFLVLDLLVATLLASTGLGMVSPATVSLPLKLVVFVMADGWSLVVQSLLDGMRTAA
jgi:flagellar biosynthetic protein FliP